jgi:RNA polymerase sigma factor (TIGR02999 family)
MLTNIGVRSTSSLAAMAGMNEVTRLPTDIQNGRLKAADELLPLVYAELRRLAASKMAREQPGDTFQATALVHEAWLRLVDADGQAFFVNRAHFFSAAAEAMRRILIERARRKLTARHGGRQEHMDLDEVEISAPVQKDDELLAVHEALEKFAAEDPEKAELVKLRYFVGLTIEDAAVVLGISVATAKRWWTYARAWLHQAIKTP